MQPVCEFKVGDRVRTLDTKPVHEKYQGMLGTVRQVFLLGKPARVEVDLDLCHTPVTFSPGSLLSIDVLKTYGVDLDTAKTCGMDLPKTFEPPCPRCGTPGYYFGFNGHNCTSKLCDYHEKRRTFCSQRTA